MVGKMTAVLIRKEAEAYRSQGLHEEAFALYDELLSSTPNIDESLKSDIQSQMDDIAEEMEAFSSPVDNQSLSSKEMMLLKDGWGNGASSAEILISAQGLCQIGAHQDALIEFGKLLKAGIAPDKVTSVAVKCFANLYNDQKLPIAIDKWLRNIYSEGKKILAVHLLFIKELSRHSDKIYAFQYCRYIRSKPSLPAKLIKRLDAANAKYKAAISPAEKKSQSKTKPENNSRTTQYPNTQTKAESDDYDSEESEVITESDINEDTIETDSEILRDLLAEQPEKLFRDDPPAGYAKKKKSQRKFFSINAFEWFGRIFRFLLPKKRR